MKNCLILTSHLEGSDFLETVKQNHYDAVICADGGLQVGERYGLLGDAPVFLIGDYDSGVRPTDEERAAARELILLPCVKDMTDSEAAIDLAVEKGFADLHVLGGLGGRLDHTLGNLSLLAKYAEDPRVARIRIEDEQNLVFLKTPGTFRVPAEGPENRFHYFGLIAWGGPVEGLSITGAKYPLEDHLLTPDTTLGVSNEVAEGAPFAEVTHTKGQLLVVFSKD